MLAIHFSRRVSCLSNFLLAAVNCYFHLVSTYSVISDRFRSFTGRCQSFSVWCGCVAFLNLFANFGELFDPQNRFESLTWYYSNWHAVVRVVCVHPISSFLTFFGCFPPKRVGAVITQQTSQCLSFFLVTSFCLESFYWTKIAAVVISYWTRPVYETWSWDLESQGHWQEMTCHIRGHSFDSAVQTLSLCQGAFLCPSLSC